FEQHREGHVALAVVGEIPGVRRHIVLRFDFPSGHDLPGLGADLGDAVDELIRRSGQARDDAALVENLVGLAERF
ncbi:MAG: hypothetical protein NT121_08140, partial [Chloroflexi bacterium]|nr:hypothetical protein [Chloroflexota bacterium]